ncbi:DEAD/DEAH box helicase [uncultured Duncaniella sp.]|uniref:DEAD/DEAH box helicase n=1 Tax=uncultured Duncaniella sp. TaxID=2768039 RepID=UPI0025E55E62|nr:DEAD/DEAH box helicase [uncultured Duncaniella sp.]
MDVSQIKQNNLGLRLHQAEAKKEIFKAWESNASVMLQMPTGTGKTYLFISIVKDLLRAYKTVRKEINILVVAHRMELIDQISETLSRFDIPHGFIQGARGQHLWRRVQVGSIMSLLTEKNYMNTQRQRFDYIIVDEAHHSLADTYVQLFNLFPEAKKLGVTATPWRFNHESFLKLYQTLVQSRQISWFIEHGVLSDFDYVSIKPDSEIQRLVDRTKIAQTGDFVNADLDTMFNSMRIRSKLYESYEKFALGRKGIIYAINRTHAAKIAELYSRHGVHAVAIDCETPKDERQCLITRFKAGDIKVLVNVDIFTEGFDCPDVSFIQLARPTRSLALYLQQVGRGLRVSEGKEKTIILDNVGLYNYFGLPDVDRKWQYHFKGLTDVEPINNNVIDDSILREPEYTLIDESKYEEADEQMLVIRGTHHEITSGANLSGDVKGGHKALPIEEFEIADYYLVRGNELNFKIYPFAKKRGKRTEGVGGCMYEYNRTNNQIILWKNPEHNAAIIRKDTKLNAIIAFAAMLLKIDMSVVYQIDKLALRSGNEIGETTSLFDMLKMLGKLQKQY